MALALDVPFTAGYPTTHELAVIQFEIYPY